MQDIETSWPADIWLPKTHLIRVVGAIIAQEVAANRRQDVHQLRPDLWDAHTALLDEGLALDSLERMNCASALNAFFHLADYGAEDYLLGAHTLGEWAYVVAVSIADSSQQITFQTSGTTGAPKSCTHKVADLIEEAQAWASHFAGVESIVAMVPPQHIYGFIWTALLPAALGAQLCDARFTSVATVKAALKDPDTLVIAAPVQWQYLSRSGLTFPSGLRAVTSTAPMSPQLAQQLHAQGLCDLTHIYGSSETGGVGWRRGADSAYKLLPYWSLSLDDGDTMLKRADGRKVKLMDAVAVHDNGSFTLLGRKDGAVQVGGLNVHPSRVEAILRTSHLVKDCSVRLCHQTQRLMADIVPFDDGDTHALEAALRAFCVEALVPAERPSSYRVATTLLVAKAAAG